MYPLPPPVSSPSRYFDAWDRWINTPANATDSELIPKCPEGSGGGGALVHDWGPEPGE